MEYTYKSSEKKAFKKYCLFSGNSSMNKLRVAITLTSYAEDVDESVSFTFFDIQSLFVK